MKRPVEAMAQIERALELDPFNALFQSLYGWDLLFMRRYDDAIAQFRKVLTTVPNHPLARSGLVAAFLQKGMHEEELANRKAVWSALGLREGVEALERGYAEGGHPEALRRAAETLAARSRTTYVRPTRVANLYASVGESDRAFEWWEKAFKERDPGLPYISVSPAFDSIRDDPRFQDLLRRMGLPVNEDFK